MHRGSPSSWVVPAARALDMIYLFVPRTFLRDNTIYATGRRDWARGGRGKSHPFDVG